jgi:ATP-dependent Lon protease
MQIFLFPLINVTLFSHTTKPLNIFEARYLQMIHRSIETQTPIAIGYVEDPQTVTAVRPGEKVPFVREIAGYGYPQIVEERLNGTLLVFIKGQGKLKLGPAVASDEPFIVCEAQIIPEVNAVRSENIAQLAALRKILVRWIQIHIPDNGQRELFLGSLNHPEEIIGAFSSYLVRDYDLQQMVLEYDDINQKIQYLHRLSASNELTT